MIFVSNFSGTQRPFCWEVKVEKMDIINSLLPIPLLLRKKNFLRQVFFAKSTACVKVSRPSHRIISNLLYKVDAASIYLDSFQNRSRRGLDFSGAE